MTKLFLSTDDAAAQLNIHRDSVSRLARQHGIGQRFGRAYLFGRRDISRLAAVMQSQPGCPKFVKGNELGKLRKKRKKISK